MHQPEGFINPGNEDKIYKLQKAVYGLKQASRAWYQKVKNILLSLEYIQCKQEECIFIKKTGEQLIIITLYVDDFFVFYNDLKEMSLLKSSLQLHFKVKDLGKVANMLGIKVVHDTETGTITLSQEHKIEQILERFGMSDCKPVKTPMIVNISSTDSCDDSCDVSKLPYQELIGALMYLCVTTRPDIAFAVSYLSQFNSCYSVNDWNNAKRILRYLKGTKNLSLVFKKSVKMKTCLEGFADADWASNSDRKSYTGYLFKYSGNTISWGCYKQSCVALSSTEAEYIALSESCREAVYLSALLLELTCKPCSVILYNDNQSAQRLVSNPVYHRRTKHIDVRYHYIRNVLEKRNIQIEYLSTDLMIADILTKPLAFIKHSRFVNGLGLC